MSGGGGGGVNAQPASVDCWRKKNSLFFWRKSEKILNSTLFLYRYDPAFCGHVGMSLAAREDIRKNVENILSCLMFFVFSQKSPILIQKRTKIPMLIFYNEEDVRKLIKTLNNPTRFHRHLIYLCLVKLLNLYKNVDLFSWSCLVNQMAL